MEKILKSQLDELVKLDKKYDSAQKTDFNFEERTQKITKVNDLYWKDQRELLVKNGLRLSKEKKKARIKALREIIGFGEKGYNPFAKDSRSYGIFARKDLQDMPFKEVSSALGIGVATQICNCGEVDLYVQPEWGGLIYGPILDYYLKGNGQGHVYDWDDAPPDFNWIIKPDVGETRTASAHMGMSVNGGEDDWNYSTAWLRVYAVWKPTNPGRFKAHVHFGGSEGPTNAGVAGDGDLLWNEGARFDAWAWLRVSYYDNGGWIELGDTGQVTIASHYESSGRTALGTCPWYWKLDHWLAKGEYSIPVNKNVCLTMWIKFKTSASHDWECYSGVFFGNENELLIRPVITGTQCTRI